VARATDGSPDHGDRERVSRWTPLLCSALAAVVVGATPADAEATPWLIPPVNGPIGERFLAPSEPYGSGHRGVDYLAAAGTQVRAAAAGMVTFAGPVAGAFAVTIAHDGGLETTYSRLDDVYVTEGEGVGQGRWLGLTGHAHTGGEEGLHFGVKLEGAYVDPAAYMGPFNSAPAIHLAPIVGWPFSGPFAGVFRSAGSHHEWCREARPVRARPPPPNDNVAVAIAGISSSTDGDDDPPLYGDDGLSGLGYPPESVYRFSYEGTAGPRFHEDYEAGATYGDIRAAAGRLRALLERIHDRHPGRGVDLIAHSQGGLVARAYLEGAAESWDPDLPQVEHLVTLATPHRGAPLAGEIDDLDDRTETGRLLLGGLAAWAGRGGPLPDPYAPAVQQMAPGSSFLSWLATEDVTYGTRVLALSTPNDWLVPPDRARYEGKANRVVGPVGLSGHKGIVSSEAAWEIAYMWLRGAGITCEGGWDEWGPRVGTVVEWAEGGLDWVVRGAERSVPGTAARWSIDVADRLWP
jgi:hypothetical protein